MVLQRYLTDLILAYARRYIRNIEAQLSLSLWGGDVVLQNLDLRLDVLQRELGVPSEFAFSRGFITELRIHIPWTALTYKPVEVTLTDVQCVLRFNAGATQAAAAAGASDATAPAASPTSAASAPPQLAAEEAAEVGGSGWAADLVTKILANLTVRIQGLSFSFVEELEEAETPRHSLQPRSGPALSIPLPLPSLPPARSSRQVLLSLRVSSVLLQSTNAGFEVEFMDLEGPWKLMHKTCDITHVCIYLGEIPPEQQRAAALASNADGSSSADAVTAKLILPDDAVILRDMSFTVRIRAYLAALGGSSLLRLPYAEDHPPAACGAAVTLDVHLHQAVDLHLSDQQLLFLMHIIETKADLMTSTAASAHPFPPPAASAAATADPLSIAHLQQHIRSSAPAIITANSLQHISLVEEMPPIKKHSPAALQSSPLSAATAAAPDPATAAPKGWTSWLWGIVGEDDESSTDRAARALNPAAEFHATFGHLAPRDEMILCFQVPAVSMHLANMKQQSTSAFSFNGTSAAQTNSEPRRKTSGATALPSSRRSATSLLTPFASVHVHEFGLQLSRQLLLPSPLGPPSRFAPPPPSPSLRPPLFSIDLVSIALVDETEPHAGRPVLMCGHEQWVRSTFRFMTRGWHDAETAAMLTHRRAPFETSPCLQQRQQWRDKGSKQSSSTHSPHLASLSTSHRALPSLPSLASSTASSTSRLPTSGNTSTGNSDDERPTQHKTAEEESMAVHGLSVMRAVIPVRENMQDSSAPVSHYRCTTDVLIGPVACVLDLSCSGQSAMVEQLFAFLDLDVTTGQVGKTRRAKFNRQSSASHATRAEHAAPSRSRQPPQIIIPPHVSSVAKSRQPRLLFEHRIILLHAVAAVRVHDAAEWKNDQLYLPHVDTLMLELAGARLCNAWHTQHTGSITQRLDGVHLHKLCLGYRQLQFHDDVWSERKPKLKDSMQPIGRPGSFSVSSSGEESWSDIGASSPQHIMDDDLDEDDGLRLLDLSALRVDLSVPALRLQSVSSDSFNNSAIAYFQSAILHHADANTSAPSSTSTSPLPSRTASPKLRPRNAAPTPSAPAAVSAAALIPATAEVSLADLRSSFSLRQLHFLFLVTGAVCGLYAPSLQALLVRLRPRASHIQMDERLTDSLLRLEIKLISTKLEVPFHSHLSLADAGATAQQLYWNFSVGSLVTSIERGGKRRNLVVAPFDRYDIASAADAATGKRDPNAADPPLLTLSFSATQDVLGWFMAIFGVSTLSARSPTMFSSPPPSSSSASVSSSLNSAVLHLHAIALVMDSIWLDMAVFFAALTTHIRAGLANYLRAAPQRSQAAGMNKQHSFTDLHALSSYPSSPADVMSHKSYPPSPLVNDDPLTPSSSTIGQFVHLVLTTFLNLFCVRLTIDPLLVCFPLNDRFHLRKHPFAFRYEDVTPLVIRLPQLHILSAPHNAHTNSLEINLYLRQAHIYAHRQQLRAQTASGLMNQPASFSRQRKSRSLRLDNYFLATSASSGMISDVLSPWSLELSARCTLAPSAAHTVPSHSSWRLSHVEITVVTKPLSISFTMQHALAVSMVVDSLRAMNVEAPSASQSSPVAPRASLSRQQATAAWAEVHNRERAEQTVSAGAAFSAAMIASDQFPYHPSSSLVLAYPLPPSVHTALLPTSYHLTLSTGKLTARFYPKCETADQLLASDMVKFDLSGIAGELACDHTFRWKQAQVAVSLSRLVYLPWQTRMAQHPVHHLFVSNGILASLERVDVPMRDSEAQPHIGGFALSQRTEVVQAHAFIQPIEVMINIPALTQLGKLFACTAPTAHKFVNAVRPAPQTIDAPAVSSPARVSDRKSTLERHTVSGGASGTLQPVQLWVCIQVERIKLAFPAPVVPAADSSSASSSVPPSPHAVACVSFELQRFWLHSNPQSVHSSVLPVVQSMVAATSAFHRPQQSHKLPYAYQCASCDLVRLRKGQDLQNGPAMSPPPPTDLFSVDGGWQHLTVSTGEYIKSVGDPSKPRAEDYVFQKAMLSNSIDVAVQAHFRVPTLIGVSATTPDPMRSGSYLPFTRSNLPHEWKLQFGVQFNPIILKLERRSLDLINSSLGGFSMSAELDAQEERMQALLGAGARGRETVEDEEERAVQQQMLAASAHPQRALDLTVQVQFPHVLCELLEAKSGSVLRLELEHIIVAHQQSVDSDGRTVEGRATSAASAVVAGSLQIGRLHLNHVRSEFNQHRMFTWRQAAQPSSSTVSSVPSAPVIVCKWTSHVMDVEVSSFDLSVPIDVLQLVVHVCQPIIHPSQVGLINSAPQPAMSVDNPAPQRRRKYRANAQTLKLLVHSGRVGIGASAAIRSQCASLQWQTIFLLQSASQCDALWQHAVMSDTLEVRVVDVECSVGTAASAEDPFPRTTCIAPFTCVLQLNYRSKITTVDAATVAQFASLQSLLSTTPRPSFVPFYRDLLLSVRVQELRLSVGFDQIAVLSSLVQQLVGLSGSQAAADRSQPSLSSPRMPVASSGVARVLFEDDFRSMKADGVGSETVPGSRSSASIRLRAGHVAFLDEPQQRVMIWKYSSPRSISSVSVRAIVGMRGSEAGASSVLVGVLSAFDPLLAVYTPVFDLLVDLQRDQYTPLPSTAIVAEEWKLTWTAPTAEHARSWAKQQGKYQRWAELINDAPSGPTLLPSSLELGQIVRVDSQLQHQHGLNIHLKLSIEHVRLALADRGADDAPVTELAIVHVQGARAGGQLWMRQPLNDSESLTRVGSALALSVVADALWLDLLQLKDLTRYPVLLPLSVSTMIRSNELAVLAPSDSGGFQFNHFLPVSLIDRRERGWCVALKANEAKFNVGLKVLLTAKLIAQRMQECLAPPPVPLSHTSSASAAASSVTASSHYVLSNRSGLPLRYGQVGTREDVALPAGADHSYSWASLSSGLAHPAHSPPEVLNAFQPHTEPRQVLAHADDRLRYHWMRLSSADVPAWSQAFMIDIPAPSGDSQMDFSSLQKNIGARSKDASHDSSLPLRHVFVYRMFEEMQPSTRSPPSASSALTPATPSSYAPRVMSSVHVAIVFVSVERRGLHTVVTFLPSHSLINRLPFSLSARCFTDAHAATAPPTLPPAATTASSPEFGFGLESRRIELRSDSATPLPLWYPCPPPQHALLYQGASSSKQAGKHSVAEPTVTPPQRTLKVLLRVHADSAPYLGRPLPQASSPASDSSRASRFPHTALPEYSELWEWSDAASVPLDSLGSYLTRAQVAPPSLSDGRRSDCRLCVVKHKLDLSQRLFFWAQLTTNEMAFRSAGAASAPTAQAFVLPSVLSPWRLTLTPAFVFHNSLSRPITLHLSSASYTQWSAAQSASHTATDRWGMWLHTASKLDAAAAALNERHSEDLNSASTPLLQSPSRAMSPAPAYASLQEVLEQGMQLEPNHTLPIMHVDPSLQVSFSFALSDQQQDAVPCSFSATTHIPSSCSALPNSNGVLLRSVALQRAVYAPTPHEARTQLHLLLSADSSTLPSPAPTLRVSFAALFKLHNLCATPMMIRSHDSFSPLSVPALTPPAGVECLQWNADDASRLCIGVQSDGDTFWSQPFSSRLNLPKKPSPSSVLQSDYELDVLAVRSDASSSRPAVLLHQFVVTVAKEVLQAMDPTATLIVCPAATAAGPCRLLTCVACAPSLPVVTHVWIKPRFVVHNRTGSAVRMQQTGTIASTSAAVSLSPGEIRSLEAWHPSAHDRHYDAKTPHEFGPSISLSFASADSSASSSSSAASDWLWSRPLTVLDECPRSSVSVYNARCGYQRLITFVVLKHRRVRHVLLFHDAQPPFIILNRTPLSIEFREEATARQKRQQLESETPSSVLAPAQCSEFSLSHSRAHSRSSSAASTVTAVPSPAADSDDDDLSDLVSALTTPSESGWEGEERVFDHKQTLNRLVMRIAGPTEASSADEPALGLWSLPVLLKPGEYSLTLPAPSPALPPVQARLAVAVRNGSILLILDALDDAGMLISPHVSSVAAPITFDAAVEIASVVVSVYDEEHASITCNIGSSQLSGASHSNRGGTPKKSAPERGSASSSPLDSMGELLLTLSLDHVQLRSQLTCEQPLHHYLPIITADTAASNAPPRRLTPLPSSILAQLYTVLELQIGGLQLDNQLEAEFPVVLFSFNSTPAYSSAASLPALKLIFVSAVPLSSTPLLQQADMHLLSLQLSSFGVNVEDRLGFRLASLGLSMARHLQYDFSRQPRPLSVPSSRDRLHAATAVAVEFEELMDKMSGARLFVHYVHIGELDFRVTVKAGAGAPVFVGAEQMPVRLDAVSLRCVLCSPDRLVQELAANYLASAIVRSPMLLGSLDLLGNPTFLLQSLSAGVRDLLFLPRNALSQGPRAFVRAVGGGLLSLLRHTTEGTLTSVSGFSSSLARNMERLSGSDLFTLQRQVLRLKRPAGLGVGLVSGVKSLSQGVIGGLVGVLSQPIAGAASGGVSGFFLGVGSGLVGVVSKPLSGMFDLVSATSQGLAHTSGVDSVAYTQRFVRRRDSSADSSSGAELHCYHRFSSLKMRQIPAQLGESYLAHAVVMFAPVAALPASNTAAASSSSAPISPPTPQSSSHAASLSAAARAGQFALLLLTNVGIRLCHDDRVTHSFQWSDVEFTHARLHQAAGPPITSLQAWLDQRTRTEWSKYGAAGPSADEDEDTKFRNSSASIAPLAFDLLSLHSSRADSTVALWVPRSIRPVLLLTAHRAQAAYSR